MNYSQDLTYRGEVDIAVAAHFASAYAKDSWACYDTKYFEMSGGRDAAVKALQAKYPNHRMMEYGSAEFKARFSQVVLYTDEVAK